MFETIRLYNWLKNRGSDIENMSIEGRVNAKLTQRRHELLHQIIQEEEGGEWISSGMSPHILGNYLRYLGGNLGIPGAEGAMYDDIHGQQWHPYRVERLYSRFLDLYTAQAVHGSINGLFNSREEDLTGMDRETLENWFQENIPQDFRRAKEAEIIQQNSADYREAVQQRQEALQELQRLYLRTNGLAPNVQAFVRELVELQINMAGYLSVLSADERNALFNRYGIEVAIPRPGEEAPQDPQIVLQRRVALAMSMNLALIPEPLRNVIQGFGMTPEQLAALGREIKALVTTTQRVRMPLPPEQLTQEQLAEKIKAAYLGVVLEDLGEERGQRVRPEAVLQFLLQMGYLEPRGANPAYARWWDQVAAQPAASAAPNVRAANVPIPQNGAPEVAVMA